MPTPASPAAEPTPAAKRTIVAEIQSAFAALRDNKKLANELVAARARIAELEGQLANRTAENTRLTTAAVESEATHTSALAAEQAARTAAESAATVAKAAFAAAMAALGIKIEDAAAKTPEQLQAAFTAAIDSRAAEQISELGFDAAGLVAAKAGDGLTAKDIAARMAEITDPAARAAYYAANRVAIFGPN